MTWLMRGRCGRSFLIIGVLKLAFVGHWYDTNGVLLVLLLIVDGYYDECVAVERNLLVPMVVST